MASGSRQENQKTLIDLSASYTINATSTSIQILGASQASAYRSIRLQALREWPPAFGSLAEEEAQWTDLEVANRLIPNDDQRFYGAYAASNLVGIVRLTRHSASNERHRAYIAGLYVDPAHRQRGVGKSLLSTCIDSAKNEMKARRLNLTVVSNQNTAISLYRSLGFEECGIEHEAFSARGEYFDEQLMTMRML